MEKHRIAKFAYLAALLSLLPATGCLIYHHDTHYEEKGKPVSTSTLDQIECGTTTKDWVLATLGEPSEQHKTPEGVEMLEYRYARKKDNQLILLPVVFINDEGKDTQILHFEISNGIVTKFWKEKVKD